MTELSVSYLATLLAEHGKKHPSNTITVADRHLAIMGPKGGGKNWYTPLIALHTPCTKESLAKRFEDGVKQAGITAEGWKLRNAPVAEKPKAKKKQAAQ